MKMSLFKFGLVLIAAALTACASLQNDGSSAAARQQLAPTGKVRVAISVGPTANTFRATLDPSTNRPRGVAVDLANALGEKLGAPVELMMYDNYVELLEAARRNAWDVTFLPFDEERTKVMDYGPAYYRFEFTYLVPSGSAIHVQADVDRPGVRIAVAEGSVTARNRQQALKNATLLRFKTLAEVREQVRAGKVDAAAAGRETLAGLAAQVPGARVLEGSFHVEGVAVAVPKNRPAALEFVSDFIETAKATGVVRRAFDNAGFKDAVVAPAASRP
ncbi:amino acid ABC transporter substrate-binding protein [Cupriavidus basilensis OR16]|uniref:Amino acid ABC transporter substrate-binding protein n=1 Tax=Cupriavidus basilensis OR16 TaxID=1127483 RepID=H1S1Z2_9BURK|nr:transporter substrate-binding domain-containing protein [Cupriavidus basilensis]EHP43486.1 amino acid ABC transporter substrate-binding protein [Cupriavidus basilensis OR16]